MEMDKFYRAKRDDMSHATEGHKDDIQSAVDGLAQFCHSWCMNVAETVKQKDLVFRCGECPFSLENGYCSVKIFVNKHGTEEQKRTAFSMS
jgi:hypothetical protein